MSLILDALRRRSRPSEPGPAANQTRQTDAVLATLGYTRKPSRFDKRFALNRYVLFALVLALLLGGIWGGRLWYTTSGGRPAPDAVRLPQVQRPPSRELAVPSPAAGAPASGPLAAAPLGPEAAPAPRSGVPDAPESSAAAAPASAGTAGGPPRTSVPAGAAASAGGPPPLTMRSSRIEVPSSAPPPPPVAAMDGRVRALQGASTATRDHFRLALYFHQAGDFDNALLHYRALLEENEFNAEAHNNLGLLYQERGLASEAIEQFQRAIIIDPPYVKAHNNLGVAYLRAGRHDAAAAEFRAALAADARNVESLTNLAVVMLETERAEDAATLLREALAIDPKHAASHYNLALILERRGEIQAAIQHYRRFIDNSGSDQAALAGEARRRAAALSEKIGP